MQERGQIIINGCVAIIIVLLQVLIILNFFLLNLRVLEGAANNLPDSQAHCVAREILSLCSSAGGGDVVVALVSGGGSALLPYPVEGVPLEDKRTVTYSDTVVI